MHLLNYRFNFIVPLMAVFVVLTATTPANAGVGILEEDENLFSANLSFTASNKHWDGDRNVITSLCKRRNAGLSLGYEYGWSYFHTVYTSANLAYRRCGSVTVGQTQIVSGRAWGLGDIEVGVRTRFSGNYLNNAAWETYMIIPAGYDGNSSSALGRGALGLGFGVKFSSDPSDRYPQKWGYSAKQWGWKAGSKFTYFFASKGNTLATFGSLQYAFTQTDFEQTGDFIEFRVDNSIGFKRGGVQQQIFVNQTPSSMTNSDQTSFKIKYSHAFSEGWSGSISIGHAFFGRNAPQSWSLGAGANYRWRD